MEGGSSPSSIVVGLPSPRARDVETFCRTGAVPAGRIAARAAQNEPGTSQISKGRLYMHSATDLERLWSSDPRWEGIRRPYDGEDVARLRGSVDIEYTLAKRGAERLWRSLGEEKFVAALGCLSGGQAVQAVKGGLKAIYLSGWQVAADANLAGQTYPDQSLYPANSAPALVKRINNAFQRADQIQTLEGEGDIDYFAPIVADAEAGFGGPLNCFEIMKAFIEAGAAGVHFEDQLASEKKCGHLGGKVLIPTRQASAISSRRV